MEVICHITTNLSNATPAQMLEANLVSTLPIPYEILELRLTTSETTVVTGPNGVGKSALLNEISRSCGDADTVETFFGSRSVSFDNENVDQIEHNLQIMSQQFRQNTTRYRQPNRDQQFRSIVRRVINAQTQSLQNIVDSQNQRTSFRKAISNFPQPLNTINSIFETALLSVRLTLNEGVLKSVRGDSEYSIDRLSDGERAALLIVGAVIVRPKNSFIIIDEPERHLNPAISGPLLSALVRSRPDVGYIFATHDLQLIQWLRPNQIVHVRDSIVIDPHSDKRRYDMAILSAENEVPEELRYAILGTRQKLMLVEGTASSEDQALYRHVYPDWNVIARGACDTVITGVRSLSQNMDYHWLTAVGIIDGDGRDDDERSKLARDHIYCLSMPTIENLFLHPVALAKMADAAHQLFGGETGVERLASVNQLLPALLAENRADIVSRRLVWEGNRLLSEQKISFQSVTGGQTSIPAIDLQPCRSRIEAQYDMDMNSTSPAQVLMRIPIKSSNIPARIAFELGFKNFSEYKNSLLKQIESKSDAGKAIISEYRIILPLLSQT